MYCPVLIFSSFIIACTCMFKVRGCYLQFWTRICRNGINKTMHYVRLYFLVYRIIDSYMYIFDKSLIHKIHTMCMYHICMLWCRPRSCKVLADECCKVYAGIVSVAILMYCICIKFQILLDVSHWQITFKFTLFPFYHCDRFLSTYYMLASYRLPALNHGELLASHWLKE